MHKHDLSLIGTYAEGTATESEATRAQEAMADCSVCQQDFELQVLALSSLSEAEPAQMTDIERMRMRRSVRDEVIGETVIPIRTAPSFASRLLPRLAVAAVGIAVVGFVGIQVFPDLGGSDAATEQVFDSAADTEDIQQEPSTLDAAAESAPFELSAEPAADELPPVDEMAADATASLQAAAPEASSLMPVDGARLPDQITAEQSAPGSLRPVALTSSDGAVLSVLTEPVPFLCVGTATEQFGSEGSLDVAGLGTIEGQVVEVFSFGGAARAFERETCTVVDSDLELPT